MSAQQTIEGALLLQEINERGYAEFEHGISADEIDVVINRYADFTLSYPNPEPDTMARMLPDHPSPLDIVNDKYFDNLDNFSTGKWMAHNLDVLKRENDNQNQWHKYRTNVENIGKPDGYSNRIYQQEALRLSRGIILDPPEDPKEFFHFTPMWFAKMARNHEEYNWGSIPPEVSSLKSAFGSIHKKAANLIIKICSLIEETHPEIRKIVTPESLNSSPVRLLFYHPSAKEQLGAGHYDKGICTLQLAESHQGLRIAVNDHSPLLNVIRDADKAAFFACISLKEQLGEDTPFQPAWHDIIKMKELNQGRHIPDKAKEICGRYALIFFVNGVNFRNIDKSLTHSR